MSTTDGDGHVPFAMADDRHARAIALYQRGDLTATEIAKRVGVSRATLYTWLSAAGVTSASKPIASPELIEIRDTLEVMRRDLAGAVLQHSMDVDVRAQIQHDVRELRAEVGKSREMIDEVCTKLTQLQTTIDVVLRLRAQEDP